MFCPKDTNEKKFGLTYDFNSKMVSFLAQQVKKYYNIIGKYSTHTVEKKPFFATKISIVEWFGSKIEQFLNCFLFGQTGEGKVFGYALLINKLS